jgi:hypothetical protein
MLAMARLAAAFYHSYQPLVGVLQIRKLRLNHLRVASFTSTDIGQSKLTAGGEFVKSSNPLEPPFKTPSFAGPMTDDRSVLPRSL